MPVTPTEKEPRFKALGDTEGRAADLLAGELVGPYPSQCGSSSDCEAAAGHEPVGRSAAVTPFPYFDFYPYGYLY